MEPFKKTFFYKNDEKRQSPVRNHPGVKALEVSLERSKVKTKSTTMNNNDKITDHDFRNAFYFMCGFMMYLAKEGASIDPRIMMQRVYENFGIAPSYPEHFGVVLDGAEEVGK